MVQTKKMNVASFVKMQKDLTATGELIRAKQDEKQALLDEFDSECKRFFFGKISEKSLMASVKKTNNELHRLDHLIRDASARSRSLSDREMKFISAQAPIVYKATLSGISGGGRRPARKVVARKPVKKKAVARRHVKKAVKKSVKRKPVSKKAAKKKQVKKKR